MFRVIRVRKKSPADRVISGTCGQSVNCYLRMVLSEPDSCVLCWAALVSAALRSFSRASADLLSFSRASAALC